MGDVSREQRVRELVGKLYVDERDRILATLIGILRDFDLAEEAMQDAFAVALLQWEECGVPGNTRAWIVGTARHKALDRLRRDSRLEQLREIEAAPMNLDDGVEDDRLRLIFTCCHPALPHEGQVALTLRTLCGIATEEIARMFLVPVATMAQRLVRVQKKIVSSGIPYYVPPVSMLADRLEAVLATVYLIFTSGYGAASELCTEAIRLGRLIVELLPAPGEAQALLALMLLQDSRRSARTSAGGDVILLEDQDRARWNRQYIDEGLRLLDTALEKGAGCSRYAVEASIAALHARAAKAEDTDWAQIAGLYAVLGRIARSPVVELNRAVAVAMAHGPDAGLILLSAIEKSGELQNYHLLPAAQAGLFMRLGRRCEAARYYQIALQLVTNDAERRFLQEQLLETQPQ